MGLFTSPKVGAERTPRDELRRRERETFAMKSGQPELKRSDLRFERFAVVHEPTGDQYKIYKGEIDHRPDPPDQRVLLRRGRRHRVPRALPGDRR